MSSVSQGGAGGVELGYAEITSTVSTSSATFVDATGLTITVQGNGRPVNVTFDCQNLKNDGAVSEMTVAIVEGSTVLASAPVGAPQFYAATMTRTVRLAGFSTSRTFKVQYKTSAGTVKIEATATAPAFIQAIAI